VTNEISPFIQYFLGVSASRALYCVTPFVEQVYDNNKQRSDCCYGKQNGR